MDKISAALIFGIVSLVLISGIIVFDTWIVDGRQEEVMMDKQVAVEDLQFNDDTSITNCTTRQLWLRARVVYEPGYDVAQYRVISEAIEKQLWALEQDGWYYYSSPLAFGQQTEPLIGQLLYQGNPVEAGGSGRFGLTIEAVEQNWLPRKPKSCTEAFNLLERLHQSPKNPIPGVGIHSSI